MEKETLNLKLVEKIQRTKDAVSFSFKKPLFKSIRYKSGQYLTLHVNIDGQLYKRAYSLNSAHSTDKDLSVTIKRVEGGKVSNFLIDNFEPGQKMVVEAPQGGFVFVPNKKMGRKIVLIGAGSGITPLYSIMKEALEKEDPEGNRLTYIEIESADHGFMCEQRASFNAKASEFAWRLLLESLNT